MTPDQIKILVQHYVSSSLKECEESRARRTVHGEEREAISCALTDALGETQSQLLRNDYSTMREVADELLQAHQLPVTNASPEYLTFCRELLIARQGLLRVELDRNDGNYWGEHLSSALLAGMIGRQGQAMGMPWEGGSSAASLKCSKPFSEVIKVYFQENSRQPRTDDQIKSGFEKFLEIIGGDKPVQEITKGQCRQYKETLLKLPRSMTAKDRQKTVSDLLSTLPAPGKYKTLGASTINKYLHNLSHLFAWAKGQGFYEGENPVDGLIINKRQHGTKEKRKPFTDEDLALIFGDEFKEQRVKRPERYWVLLILLFTGARREEAAQLLVSDVKEHDGIWYFDITPDEELGERSGEPRKKLKTQGSKRRVPIHSKLLEFGFLRYVEETKKGRHSRLFYQLEKNRNGYGDAVGKWFGRHLNKIGITDPAKVIHSFRHTVVTRLTAAGVPQDMREVIVGHAAENVHGQTYVHREGIPLALLMEHLEKLDFRGLLK